MSRVEIKMQRFPSRCDGEEQKKKGAERIPYIA